EGDMYDYEIYETPWYSYYILSLVINEGVTSIGNAVFCYCLSLASVEIPDSVTSIGDDAFHMCTSLTDAEIPGSVTSIGDNAFLNCYRLRNVQIPDSVITIGSGAFSGCNSFTSVEIPDSVTNIGDSAFASCSGLTDIKVSDNNPCYTSTEGILFDKEMRTLIQYPSAKNGETYVFPESVTAVGSYAFSKCSKLISLNIPAGVTSIGDCAFFDSERLTDIEVSEDNSCYTSEDGVLFDREMRKLVQYPAGKDSGIYAIPEGVTNIGSYAFACCSSLTGIEMPDSVAVIDDCAFSNCYSLEDVELPVSLTSIGSLAFALCGSLTSIEIPSEVKSIGDNAFRRCSGLKIVKILSPDVYIGPYVFTFSYPTLYGIGGSTAEAYAKENEIPFSILEQAPVPEITSAEAVTDEETGVITVSVSVSDIPAGAALIAVGYSGGYVSSAARIENGTAELEAGASEVKVFCWRSLKHMVPLCNAKTVEIAE
ncbi:MAG: leucine-rich repeat domain-containing protein, partial [Candidatus Ornithomonoglobus sp.]